MNRKRRRQAFVTVQPYDEMPYWAEAGIWEACDDTLLGCVSLDPFGTNRMAAEWASAGHETDGDEDFDGRD